MVLQGDYERPVLACLICALPASRCRADERAADPLHRAWINAKARRAVNAGPHDLRTPVPIFVGFETRYGDSCKLRHSNDDQTDHPPADRPPFREAVGAQVSRSKLPAR
jgi:hypothetical protein